MPYWGNGPIDNDYAFDTLGAYVVLIRERLFKDAENVLSKAHPEQAIIASLHCLRVLDAEFPTCVRVSFRRKDLERAIALFEAWLERVRDALPAEQAKFVRVAADAEFERYRAQLGPRP